MTAWPQERRSSPRYSFNATAVIKTTGKPEVSRVRVVGLGIAGCRIKISHRLAENQQFLIDHPAERRADRDQYHRTVLACQGVCGSPLYRAVAGGEKTPKTSGRLHLQDLHRNRQKIFDLSASPLRSSLKPPSANTGGLAGLQIPDTLVQPAEPAPIRGSASCG